MSFLLLSEYPDASEDTSGPLEQLFRQFYVCFVVGYLHLAKDISAALPNPSDRV